MRTLVLGIAVSAIAASPAVAQSPRDITGPWTLTPSLVHCTDLPLAYKPQSRLRLHASHTPDDRLAMAAGEYIIKRVADDGLAVGQRYTAMRLTIGAQYRFPKPEEGFADARIAGIVSITALDEVNAIARIELSCDGIEPGDFLEPFVETTLPLTVEAMERPDFTDRGRVVFGADNRAVFGMGDTTSIDRGTIHGVVPGARFAFYRDKRNGQPLIYMGEAVVLSTSELTSKVMVTKSVDGVESGDLAIPRRQQ